jgi:hypothetical protein
MWQAGHIQLIYLPPRIPAIIERISLDRIRWLSTKDFGHALGKNHCSLGGGRLFITCI